MRIVTEALGELLKRSGCCKIAKPFQCLLPSPKSRRDGFSFLLELDYYTRVLPNTVNGILTKILDMTVSQLTEPARL